VSDDSLFGRKPFVCINQVQSDQQPFGGKHVAQVLLGRLILLHRILSDVRHILPQDFPLTPLFTILVLFVWKAGLDLSLLRPTNHYYNTLFRNYTPVDARPDCLDTLVDIHCAIAMAHTITPKPCQITLLDEEYGRLSQRQLLATSTNPIPTSSTYDYWWPFPAANTQPALPPANPTDSQGPPVLISLVSASAVDASTLSSSRAESSSATFSSVFLSSLPTSTASNSQTHSAINTPVTNATAGGMFHLVDLVPVAAALGIFVIGVAIWFLCGCFTRRPRMREDDDELICGPPYIPEQDNYVYPHETETWQEQQNLDMLEIPKHRNRGISGQLRWSSFHEPPSFDPVKGFHVPEEYLADEDERGQFLTAALVVPPARDSIKSKPSSKKERQSRSKSSSHSHSRLGSPSPSDATSVALMKLYESDDEEEERRRAKEVPWESLRHKSIKRGILEQVKKENKWMDSIRSSIASGSAILGGNKRQERNQGEIDISNSSTDASTRSPRMHHQVGKRRGHVRVNSDLFDDVSQSDMSNDIQPLRVAKSSGGARREYTLLKDDSVTQDKYTPMPSMSRSRSQSSSPAKRHRMEMDPRDDRRHELPISRNILPMSPTQILSPPLKSQICFTPVPPVLTRKAHVVTRSRSKSRSGSSASPKVAAYRNARMNADCHPLPSLPHDDVDATGISPHSTSSPPQRLGRKNTGPFRSKGRAV